MLNSEEREEINRITQPSIMTRAEAGKRLSEFAYVVVDEYPELSVILLAAAGATLSGAERALMEVVIPYVVADINRLHKLSGEGK
jgi:hypothetical protein